MNNCITELVDSVLCTLACCDSKDIHINPLSFTHSKLELVCKVLAKCSYGVVRARLGYGGVR